MSTQVNELPIQSVIGFTSNASDILELGAGRGALSRTLYSHYQAKSVTVTDNDLAQLEKASEYFAAKLQIRFTYLTSRIASHSLVDYCKTAALMQ